MQKKIVVSGAGGALGSAVVKKFVEENYFVAGIYHREGEAEGAQVAAAYVTDLSDEKAAGETVKQMINELGTVDVLACIAGGFRMDNIENAASEAITNQIKLNFFTAYHLVKPFYDHMKGGNGGRIFLTGSRQGMSPRYGVQSLSYTLSKSLLFSLAEILNAGKDSNVVTSVIVPSTLDTPANRKVMPGADFSKWVPPADIAGIMAFYASSVASAIREPVIKVFNHS